MKGLFSLGSLGDVPAIVQSDGKLVDNFTAQRVLRAALEHVLRISDGQVAAQRKEIDYRLKTARAVLGKGRTRR